MRINEESLVDIMEIHSFSTILNNQRGVTAVIIGICLFMLVGFVALAIDVGHLYVVKNELQNAADAGALAGARHLYTEAALIDEDANLVADAAARANIGDNKSVEVINPASNADDVQRGHWSFATRTFTRRDETTPPSIWGKSFEDLDAMTEFVNAVQVIARRDSLPIMSFFAGIFGYSGFKGAAKAVAYVSPSAGWLRADFDQPIAICAQSLMDPGTPFEDIRTCLANPDCEMKCNIGRMLDSSGKPTTTNTAAWTNFSDPCSTANASEMNDLVCQDCDAARCSSGSEDPYPDPSNHPCCQPLSAGSNMGATGGVQQVTFDKFRDCWKAGANCTVVSTEPYEEDCSAPVVIDSDAPGNDPWGMEVPDKPWKLKLPVVDCPGHNVSNCPELVGAVEVSLAWVTRAGTPDPSLDTPYKMEGTSLTGDWPQQTLSGDYVGAENTAETLSGLEEWGFPSKYTEDLALSSSECASPPDPSSEIPTVIRGLSSNTTLSTQVSGLLTSHGYQLSDAYGNLSKITPQELVDSGHTFQFFDIKDPGVPAPNPNAICSMDDYERLLINRLADAAGMARWASFVKHFKLKNWDGQNAPLTKKSLFFLPTCGGIGHMGTSGTAGAFGIMAKVPVLVN